MSLVRPRLLGVLVCGACACSTPSVPPTDVGIVIPDTNVPPDRSLPDTGPLREEVQIFVRDGANGVGQAHVAIDDANGDRHEVTTPLGGHVTVPAVAWEQGRVSITVWASGYPLVTLAGFRHLDLASRVDSSGEIAIDLVPYQTTVSLTGMLLNVADPSHYLDVLLTVDGAVTVTGTSFAGAVPARAPFRICAIERAFSGTSAYLYSNTPIAFACVDRPGASGATTVDIDMSMGLALSTLSGRFVAPPSGHPLQGAVPRVFVRDDATAGRYLLGYTSSMAPDADGVSYDFSVVHLSMPGVTTPLAEYYLESATSYSSIFVDGMPGDHPLTDATEWLAAPALMSPLPGSAAGLHDPIVVAPFDPSVPIYLQLRNQYGEVWSLEPAPGVTSLSFPLPPTGTDMRYWMNMRVELYACDPWPGHRSACRRDSGGDTYTVM